MSGHLCLKWNNHSSAFQRSISTIQIKERYCDATIACQGKYFPVHRIILSTCSDYFDEIFERMQCQHPYIVFKDIEPKEMEMLLNYMYQGEVNVLQEMLPSLIRAAEALQIKGLAVPDDMPSTKEFSSSKKRSSSSTDHPQPKRRLEERKRRNSPDFSSQAKNSDSQEFDDSGKNNTLKSFNSFDHLDEGNEPKIKEEPPEAVDLSGTNSDLPDRSSNDAVGIPPFFSSFGDSEDCLKEEEPADSGELFEEQGAAAWSNYAGENTLQSLPPSEIPPQEDIDKAHHTPILWTNSSAVHKLSMTSTEDRPVVSSANSDVKKPLFKCPSCNYKSDRKYNVKLHITSKHSIEKPFQCGICSMRFKLKHTLLAHMRRHKKDLLLVHTKK